MAYRIGVIEWENKRSVYRGGYFMQPWSFDTRGRFEETIFESKLLKDNPLHDPYQRPLWVYLPPDYDDEPDKRYPTIYQIKGLTGQLDMWHNRSPFRKNFPELVDDMFA